MFGVQIVGLIVFGVQIVGLIFLTVSEQLAPDDRTHDEAVPTASISSSPSLFYSDSSRVRVKTASASACYVGLINYCICNTQAINNQIEEHHRACSSSGLWSVEKQKLRSTGKKSKRQRLPRPAMSSTRSLT